MTITMDDSQLQTIAEVEIFLKSAVPLRFLGESKKEEIYEWIEDALIKFEYIPLRKADKGIVREYIQKMSGYSGAQITRLIKQYTKRGTIQIQPRERNIFPTVYSSKDIELLAKTDELHEFPNGHAIKTILGRMYRVYGRHEYGKISEISVAHIYNLRQSPTYLRITKKYEKTKPQVINIGERRRPDPEGKPGYLRVDSVHQGDAENGEKGVYHINIVDEVTQTEYVVAVERISQAYLVVVLERIITICPFVILGFHSDNGGEFINKVVAQLLNRLLIEFTKSRSRHSNDNGLVEGKNNAIIRKWMGYGFIEQKHAEKINVFYFGVFHEYLNYHRPCAFATNVADERKKGKIRKVYYQKDYKTPYEKLQSLPNWIQYLKPRVTPKDLEIIAMRKTDNEIAEEVQRKRYQLFSQIFPPAYSSRPFT